MKRNVGRADAAVRVVLAAVIVVLYATGSVTGTAAVILGVIAAVLLVTGVSGFCPAYAAAGVSTRKRKG